MSLGYKKGQYWVEDKHYAVYTTATFYVPMLHHLRRKKLIVKVSYSYIGRCYSAEIFSVEKFGNSAQYYTISRALASDPHPVSAMVQAIQSLDDPGVELLACCLEAETLLLAEALRVAISQDAKLEQLCLGLDALAAAYSELTSKL